MKKLLYILLLVIGTAFMAGFGPPVSGALSQSKGGLTVSLNITPQPPVAMEPVTLLLTLTDATGRAITGADIAYDLTMPEMAMPPNRPPASEEAEGQYRSRTVFTMSGKWHIKVTVNNNGRKDLFVFETSVN